jgi:hypothetical protein
MNGYDNEKYWGNGDVKEVTIDPARIIHEAA